ISPSRVTPPEIDLDSLSAWSSCERNNANRGLGALICGTCARKALTSTSGATSKTFLILLAILPGWLDIDHSASRVSKHPIEWQRMLISFTFALAAIVVSNCTTALREFFAFSTSYWYALNPNTPRDGQENKTGVAGARESWTIWA